jgi:hypothetical protein
MRVAPAALPAQILARVFRSKENCSALRKAHVLFLARRWGYRSDLWVRRDKRTQPESAGAAAGIGAPASGGAAAVVVGDASGKRKRGAAAAADEACDVEPDAVGVSPDAVLMPWHRLTPPSPPPPEVSASLDDGLGAGGADAAPKLPAAAGGRGAAAPRRRAKRPRGAPPASRAAKGGNGDATDASPDASPPFGGAAAGAPPSVVLSPAGTAAAHALSAARQRPPRPRVTAAVALSPWRQAAPPQPPQGAPSPAAAPLARSFRAAPVVLAQVPQQAEVLSFAAEQLRPLAARCGKLIAGGAACAAANLAMRIDAGAGSGVEHITQRTMEARCARGRCAGGNACLRKPAARNG